MWDRLHSDNDQEETSFFEGGAIRPSFFDEPVDSTRKAFDKFRIRGSRVSVSSYANNELAEQACLRSQDLDDLAIPISVHRSEDVKDFSRLYTFNGQNNQSAASSKKMFESFARREFDVKDVASHSLFNSQARGATNGDILLPKQQVEAREPKSSEGSVPSDKIIRDGGPSSLLKASQFTFNKKLFENTPTSLFSSRVSTQLKPPQNGTNPLISNFAPAPSPAVPYERPLPQKKLVNLNQLPPRSLLIKPSLPVIKESLIPREETTLSPLPIETSDDKLSLLEIMQRRKKSLGTPSPNDKATSKKVQQIPADLLPILYELSEAIQDKSPEPVKKRNSDVQPKPITSPTLSTTQQLQLLKESKVIGKQDSKKDIPPADNNIKPLVAQGRMSPLSAKFELNLPFGRVSEASRTSISPNFRMQAPELTLASIPASFGGSILNPPPSFTHPSAQSSMLTIANNEQRCYDEWKQALYQQAESSYNLALDQLRIAALSAALREMRQKRDQNPVSSKPAP